MRSKHEWIILFMRVQAHNVTQLQFRKLENNFWSSLESISNLSSVLSLIKFAKEEDQTANGNQNNLWNSCEYCMNNKFEFFVQYRADVRIYGYVCRHESMIETLTNVNFYLDISFLENICSCWVFNIFPINFNQFATTQAQR